MAQQTPVSFLSEQLERLELLDKGEVIKNIFEQADRMFQNEIIKAHSHHRCLTDKTMECSIKAFDSAKKYYNKTYNK